jgi:predicted ribonuclease YlaK
MVIVAFRGSSIATSLVLERCVRSELAEEAADRL